MAGRKTSGVIRKIVGWAGLLLLILATIVGTAWYHAASRDFYFDEIKALTREMAGYDLEKTGPLSLSLFPVPTLEGKNVRVTNPGLAEHATVARIDEMAIGLPWSSLLRLKLDLEISLAAPKISLDIDIDGTRNWMTPALEDLGGDPPFDVVRVDTAELELLFSNRQANEILGIDVHQFDVDLRKGGGSARVETAGRLGKTRFFVIGDVIQPDDRDRFTVNLDFGAGRARQTRVDAVQAPSVSWWIRQNAVLFPIHGAIRGELGLRQQLPAGELELELDTAALGDVLELVDAPTLPIDTDVGPLRASGRVVLTGSDVDVRDLTARIDQPALGVELRGSVSNLLSSVESALTARARSDDLNQIIDISALIPEFGAELARSALPSEFDATLGSKGADLTLEDVRALVQRGPMSARIAGRASMTGSDLDYEGSLSAEAPDTAELLRVLGSKGLREGESGSVRLAVTASGNRKRVEIEDARAEIYGGLGRLVLSGSIDLSGALPVLDPRTQIDVLEAQHLGAYFPELPDPVLDDLALSMQSNVKGALNDLSLLGIDLQITRADRALTVNGDATGLPGNPAADVDFRFHLETPLDLENYLPQLGPQQLTGPLDLTGKVIWDRRHLVIDQLDLRARGSDARGLIDIDFSKRPARVVALFDSDSFQTNFIAAEPEDAPRETPPEPEPTPLPESGAAQQSPGARFQEFLNGVEINTRWISDLDLYLSFTAKRAVLGGYEIEDHDLVIDARNGVLALANFEVTLAGRPMALQGYIDVNQDPPAYLFAGKVEKESLEALLQLEEQMLEGGELTGEFTFFSEGDTLGELIGNLEGNALVQMGPLLIRSKALDLVSSDIFQSMLGGITRSPEERRSTRYQCGVLGVDVRRGVARINKTFTLQAQDYNLSGQGRIDLNTGYVELAARPRAKKGLGISLSSVIGGFRVEGHVATPKFGLGGGGLVSAAILGYALSPTMAAAAANPVTASIVATGFFAKGILDRLTASSYSCKKTLARIERNRYREIRPRNPDSGRMGL